MKEKITDLHKGHRKRQREIFIKSGLDDFYDHQVLELLLFYAYVRIDTKPIAKKMIDNFGGINNLFEANPKDIMRICNVSENVAVLVSLTSHLVKRYLNSRWKKNDLLNNTKVIGEYALSIFIREKYECFYVIFLNSQHRLLGSALVHEGSIDSVTIHPRNIVEICLRHNASYVAFAHNHPSGDLYPSREDIDVTTELQRVLSMLEIDVVDHIIVGGNDFFSFTQNDLLGPIIESNQKSNS